jgi:processing peptidase subunit alpha
MKTSNSDNKDYKHLDKETLDKLPEDLEVGILFESFDWQADQMVTLNTAYTLLGNSQSFSSGGPGKGMHARTTRMLNTTYYLNSAGAVNSLFTDTGLFGL